MPPRQINSFAHREFYAVIAEVDGGYVATVRDKDPKQIAQSDSAHG